MKREDFVGSRIKLLREDLGGKGKHGEISSFPKEFNPPQNPSPSPKNSELPSKDKKPMLYRLIVSLAALGIGVYMLCIGITEAGVGIIAAIAGYWTK
jgi:hypothetical protein